MSNEEKALAAEFASASSKLSNTEKAYIKGWLAGRSGSKEEEKEPEEKTEAKA